MADLNSKKQSFKKEHHGSLPGSRTFHLPPLSLALSAPFSPTFTPPLALIVDVRLINGANCFMARPA